MLCYVISILVCSAYRILFTLHYLQTYPVCILFPHLSSVYIIFTLVLLYLRLSSYIIFTLVSSVYYLHACPRILSSHFFSMYIIFTLVLSVYYFHTCFQCILSSHFFSMYIIFTLVHSVYNLRTCSQCILYYLHTFSQCILSSHLSTVYMIFTHVLNYIIFALVLNVYYIIFTLVHSVYYLHTCSELYNLRTCSQCILYYLDTCCHYMVCLLYSCHECTALLY